MVNDVAAKRFSFGPRFQPWEWWWIVGILAGFGIVALWLLKAGGPFGHDESVYALRARDFHAGTDPGLYWLDIRAPGLPWLGRFAWLASATPPVLRFIVAGFGALLVAETWLAGRYLFGRIAGLVAAAGIATTPVILQSSTQFWPDVPGAALGLGVLAVFLFSTGSERVSWWVVTVAPLAAAATYVRYGAPIAIGAGLLVLVLWRWRSSWLRSPPMLVAGAATALVVGAILLVPRFTGGNKAPLDAIGGRPKDWFQGFVDYVRQAGDIVGNPAGVLLVVGLVVAIVLALRGGLDRSTVIATGAVAVVTLIPIAVLLQGELRYLSPVWPWVWVLAGAGLVPLIEAAPKALAPAVAGAVAAALLIGAADAGGAVNEFNKDEFTQLKQAALEIKDHAGGRECGVVTGFLPQVEWYTECTARGFPGAAAELPGPSLRGDDAIYIVYVQQGKRQPGGQLERDLREQSEVLSVVEGQREVEVLVWRDR